MEATSSNSKAYQLWFYHVSHSHMVIRQPKDREEGYNTDFFFSGVEYLDFPTIMHTLSIETADEISAKEYCDSHSIKYYSQWDSLFILSCDEGIFHVVAAGMTKECNQDDIMDVEKYNALHNLY